MLPVTLLACVAFAMSLQVRLDDARPPAAAVPPVLLPPEPPVAVCDRVSVLPLVDAVTAFVSVLLAAAPPLPLVYPSPPAPPVWETPMFAEKPDPLALVPLTAPPT